jgi:hypothetical protein
MAMDYGVKRLTKGFHPSDDPQILADNVANPTFEAPVSSCHTKCAKKCTKKATKKAKKATKKKYRVVL